MDVIVKVCRRAWRHVVLILAFSFTLISQVGLFGGLRGAYYDGTSESRPLVAPHAFFVIPEIVFAIMVIAHLSHVQLLVALLLLASILSTSYGLLACLPSPIAWPTSSGALMSCDV